MYNKQVRVFYKGFQTRENNIIQEIVYQAILLLFLVNL